MTETRLKMSPYKKLFNQYHAMLDEIAKIPGEIRIPSEIRWKIGPSEKISGR